jgi:hypothetical protein
MDMEIQDGGPDPKPSRRQFETRGMYCEALCGEDGSPYIRQSGQRFPSLQLWDFGLLPKDGVSMAEMEALAARINELCDGAYANFHSDRDMDGVELYETDEWGLAKLR